MESVTTSKTTFNLDELTFHEWCRGMWSQKLTVLLFALSSALCALYYTLTVHKTWTATVIISAMPYSQLKPWAADPILSVLAPDQLPSYTPLDLKATFISELSLYKNLVEFDAASSMKILDFPAEATEFEMAMAARDFIENKIIVKQPSRDSLAASISLTMNSAEESVATLYGYINFIDSKVIKSRVATTRRVVERIIEVNELEMSFTSPGSEMLKEALNALRKDLANLNSGRTINLSETQISDRIISEVPLDVEINIVEGFLARIAEFNKRNAFLSKVNKILASIPLTTRGKRSVLVDEHYDITESPTLAWVIQRLVYAVIFGILIGLFWATFRLVSFKH